MSVFLICLLSSLILGQSVSDSEESINMNSYKRCRDKYPICSKQKSRCSTSNWVSTWCCKTCSKPAPRIHKKIPTSCQDRYKGCRKLRGSCGDSNWAMKKCCRTCSLQPNVKNGGWTSWSGCSKTCGSGRQYRSCTLPSLFGSGTQCTGSKSKACNTQACPVTITSRLVNSHGTLTTGHTGLLQLYVSGVWKYVCDDYFDLNNHGANVACTEMGYKYGKHADGQTPNGISDFYDDIKCTGNEKRLADCSRAVGHNCGSGEAVTLSCTRVRESRRRRRRRSKKISGWTEAAVRMDSSNFNDNFEFDSDE